MKFLCVSDQVDPLVYSFSLKERFKDVDVVFAAGDLPFEYISFIVSILNKPLYYVLGNHDDETAASRGEEYSLARVYDSVANATGAIDAGSRVRNEEGLIIAGIPGCMRYNRGRNQYTEFQMWLKAFALAPRLFLNKIFKGRAVDVLLTHAPPKGIHDRNDLCHRGFASFLWLMRVFKPRYLIHGHIHLYDLNDVRVSDYRGTSVVNAFGHCLVNMEGR
jgi:Icc-related predicted phosphoesterase